jgi:hypothetical protein
VKGVKPVAVAALSLAMLGAGASIAVAHESRPGFLELRESGPNTYSFLWKKPSGGEIEIYIAPILPKECRLATAGQQQLTPGALIVRGTLTCEGGIEGKAIAIDGLETTNSTPFGIRPPSRANRCGVFRNWMVSCNSSIASSAPPTSLNVTLTSSALTSVALLFPTPKIPPPTRLARLRLAMDQSDATHSNGNSQFNTNVLIGLGGRVAR